MHYTIWVCKKCGGRTDVFNYNGLRYISCDNPECNNFCDPFLLERDPDFSDFFIEKDYGMIKIMPDQYIQIQKMFKNLIGGKELFK